ncbi:MAG: FkbM family methyltransferase [Deltaproteobacteria bacterium]|jgi:FkbM family methyltransferase|nr:FkbM family methyltransferase [Deltaproteobacteria bacterium]
MPGTRDFWNERYTQGIGAGSGSYGALADYKAEIVNAFARDHGVESAVDLGCGDGYQAGLLKFYRYTGLDISEAGARKCMDAFLDNTSARIEIYNPDGPPVPAAEIALSMDVAYCIAEDDLFDRHMEGLFGAAERFVLVYSTNTDSGNGVSPNFRNRRFTDWVAAKRPGWTLAGFLPNRYPLWPGAKQPDRSPCSFYFFSRGEPLGARYALFQPGNLGPVEPVADEFECQECMKLAMESMGKGSPEESLNHIERIIAYQAGKGAVDPRSFSNYGTVLTALGRLGEAEKAFRASLCLEPANRDARSKIARVHLSEKNWESLSDYPDELMGVLEAGQAKALVPEIARNLPKLLNNPKFKAMADRCPAVSDGGEDMALRAARPVVPSEWENRHSPSCVLPLYAKGMAEPDFPARLKALLANLEPEDKAKICRIVNSLQKLSAKGADPASVFAPEETEEINRLKDGIRDRTVKLSEELFCFDGYFLPISHFGPDIFSSRLGMKLLRNPERLRGKDIIDAGGYCGDSALVLSEATDGKVHVFEPVPPHLEMVKRTLKHNCVENCVLVPLALGECEKESVIYFFGSGSSLSKFDKKTEGQLAQIKVKVVALDDYVAEHKIDVGFIKVDIEGYEQPFLQGARKTIAEQRPAMSISIYHNYDDFFRIKTVIEGWDLGYKFRISKTPDGNAVVETALVCEAA